MPRTALTALLLLGLALRLACGLLRPADARTVAALPDQGEYLQLAQNFLGGHGLVMPDPHFGQNVYAYRAPGYPLFVAALGASLRAVRIAQALLDASAILAVYWLARFWCKPRWALTAAALVAINPFLIYFSSLLLSETLFAALLIWGMALLVRGGYRAWAGAALLALSVLVRPEAMALPVLLIFMSPLAHAGFPRLRRTLGSAAGMALLIALFLFPWAYRNSRVIHHWVWTTTNAGISAYDGLNPQATGASDQRWVADLPALRGLDEYQRDRFLAKKAMDWALAHPADVLRLAAHKIARTWSPMPLSTPYDRPAYRVIALTFSLPLDLLAIWGLLASGRLPRRGKALCLIPAIYLTVVHAAFVGSLRYRLAAEPPLALLAAAGWPRRADGGKVRST